MSLNCWRGVNEARRADYSCAARTRINDFDVSVSGVFSTGADSINAPIPVGRDMMSQNVFMAEANRTQERRLTRN